MTHAIWIYITGFSLVSLWLTEALGQTPEDRLQELGIELSMPGEPVANYVPAVRSGQLLFLSGAGPLDEDGQLVKGKIGRELTTEEGRAAARLVAIRQLGVIKHELGELSKVKRIVKVNGMVNCTEYFEHHPEVINGFSDLMADVFGDKGLHARAAVGMNALPCNPDYAIEFSITVLNGFKISRLA